MTKHRSLEQRLHDLIENNSAQEVELAIHKILIKLDNDLPLTDETKVEIIKILRSAASHVSDIAKYIDAHQRKGGTNE